MNAMPIFMYVDELLSGVWLTWCKDTLRNDGETRYLTPRGFQEKQGTTGANIRTRALEAYLLGLLKAPVINSRGEDRENIPSGWRMTYTDGAISRFGYLCYATGEGLLRANHGNAISDALIQDALSVICGIMLLQLGFNDGRGHSILTVALFRHILLSYPKPAAISESKWQRYVAAALFCTLEDDSNNVIDSYLAGTPFVNLVMTSDTGTRDVADPAALEALITKNYSLTGIKKTKTSLFFIGSFDDDHPRGIYTEAIRKCDNLLTAVCAMERTSITNGNVSPFRFWDTDDNIGRACVLDALNKSFSSVGKDEWRRAMITLKNGVLEAIRFIGDGEESSSPISFYTHGVNLHADGEIVVIEVPKASCDSRVTTGSRIEIGTDVCEVTGIEDAEGIKKITVRKHR